MRGTVVTTTWPIFAVTCPVPTGAGDQLRVGVTGRTVTAASPTGFQHTFELPVGAATDLLEWRVYADILEVRVPYPSLEQGTA
jgi:hypothetical protein